MKNNQIIALKVLNEAMSTIINFHCEGLHCSECPLHGIKVPDECLAWELEGRQRAFIDKYSEVE